MEQEQRYIPKLKTWLELETYKKGRAPSFITIVRTLLSKLSPEEAKQQIQKGLMQPTRSQLYIETNNKDIASPIELLEIKPEDNCLCVGFGGILELDSYSKKCYLS